MPERLRSSDLGESHALRARTDGIPAPRTRPHAHYVWELARRSGAQVLLRIEDHDRERCKPEYEVGPRRPRLARIRARHFSDKRLSGGPVRRQAERRHHIYQTAAQELAARGLLYGCSCTRPRDSGGTGPA